MHVFTEIFIILDVLNISKHIFKKGTRGLE